GQVISDWDTTERLEALAARTDIAHLGEDANPRRLAMIRHARMEPLSRWRGRALSGKPSAQRQRYPCLTAPGPAHDAPPSAGGARAGTRPRATAGRPGSWASAGSTSPSQKPSSSSTACGR